MGVEENCRPREHWRPFAAKTLCFICVPSVPHLWQILPSYRCPSVPGSTELAEVHRWLISELSNELFLAQHRHAELFCFVQLAAGRFAGNEEAGLFADAARRLAAELDD